MLFLFCFVFFVLFFGQDFYRLDFYLPVTSRLKWHVALFPASSTASQVTVVCPIGNRLPACGEHVTSFTCPELSVALGCFHNTNTVEFPSSVDVDISFGHGMSGDSVSVFKQNKFCGDVFL